MRYNRSGGVELRLRAAIALVSAAVGLAGCGSGGGGGTTSPAPLASFRLSSPAFKSGDPLPARLTCVGKGTSPALAWSITPARTRALALVLDDPDAAGGDFTHWVVVLQAGTGALPAGGIPHSLSALNSAGTTGYAPPCPPPGDKPHHYVFTLYALSRSAGFKRGADPVAARRAIASRAIASGRLVGTFAR